MGCKVSQLCMASVYASYFIRIVSWQRGNATDFLLVPVGVRKAVFLCQKVCSLANQYSVSFYMKPFHIHGEKFVQDLCVALVPVPIHIQ